LGDEKLGTVANAVGEGINTDMAKSLGWVKKL
jgi:hypothetical protein